MARLAIVEDCWTITGWIEADDIRSCWIMARLLRREGVLGYDDVTDCPVGYHEDSDPIIYRATCVCCDNVSFEQLRGVVAVDYNSDFDGVELADGTRLVYSDEIGYHTEGNPSDIWLPLTITGWQEGDMFDCMPFQGFTRHIPSEN